jgi:hypothetical protein
VDKQANTRLDPTVLKKRTTIATRFCMRTRNAGNKKPAPERGRFLEEQSDQAIKDALLLLLPHDG